MGKIVGIDLGTTNSVVAVMEGGRPVVIANTEGQRTTPSVVGFSKDGERLVGQMARRQSVLNPQNTFYSVKRFIGRKYSELNPESKRVAYTIRRDDTGNIKIKCPRLERDFAPEEISAMVLRKLADEASKYLGVPVTGAVITVPAYFDDSQRQATRDAGRIAGLEVKRILNEPTAASLAYGLDKKTSETVLVFDLGGGTFDVSILEVGDGVFEVKATSGDTQLGGNDFDDAVVDWLAEQFLRDEGIDLRKDRQALQRLTEASEKAKIELSNVSETMINLPFITATQEGPKHLDARLTRAQFDQLTEHLLERVRGPVEKALRDSGLSRSRIDEVVMVGGSTRIPAVQALVRELVGKEPNQSVNPDEVVAVGAAVQAGVLAGEVRDLLLLDVTPLSIGLETIGGITNKLIPRNTTVPTRKSKVFSTAEDNQPLVEVHVVQGEREMADDNKSLGRFKLQGIEPAPRGMPQIEVTFDLDANGILNVSAQDLNTGREKRVTIQGASTLKPEEVGRMIRDAEASANTDRQRRDRIEKRNKAESFIYQAERQLKDLSLGYDGYQISSELRTRIETLVRELRGGLERDDDGLIDRKQSELQEALYDLSRELYQQREAEESDWFGGGGGREEERYSRSSGNDDFDWDDIPDEPAPRNDYSRGRAPADRLSDRPSRESRESREPAPDRPSREPAPYRDRDDDYSRPRSRPAPPSSRPQSSKPSKDAWDDDGWGSDDDDWV